MQAKPEQSGTWTKTVVWVSRGKKSPCSHSTFSCQSQKFLFWQKIWTFLSWQNLHFTSNVREMELQCDDWASFATFISSTSSGTIWKLSSCEVRQKQAPGCRAPLEAQTCVPVSTSNCFLAWNRKWAHWHWPPKKIAQKGNHFCAADLGWCDSWSPKMGRRMWPLRNCWMFQSIFWISTKKSIVWRFFFFGVWVWWIGQGIMELSEIHLVGKVQKKKTKPGSAEKGFAPVFFQIND